MKLVVLEEAGSDLDVLILGQNGYCRGKPIEAIACLAPIW
jgi:hypothetical protein